MGDDSDDDEFNASLPPEEMEKEKAKIVRRSIRSTKSVAVVKRGPIEKKGLVDGQPFGMIRCHLTAMVTPICRPA